MRLINNAPCLFTPVYAYPTFAKKYGKWDASTRNYQVTAPWQSGLSNASGVGAFFGVLLNGWLTSRFGMKRVILASLVILSAFIFMTFLAPNIQVLLAGKPSIVDLRPPPHFPSSCSVRFVCVCVFCIGSEEVISSCAPFCSGR